MRGDDLFEYTWHIYWIYLVFIIFHLVPPLFTLLLALHHLFAIADGQEETNSMIPIFPCEQKIDVYYALTGLSV